MTFATYGLRRWTQRLWQRTCAPAALAYASAWPVRRPVALPLLGTGDEWQAALARTLTNDDASAADDNTAGLRPSVQPDRPAQVAPDAMSDDGNARQRLRRGRRSPARAVAEEPVDTAAVAALLAAGADAARQRPETALESPARRTPRAVANLLAARARGHAAPAPAEPVATGAARRQWTTLVVSRAAARLASRTVDAAGGRSRSAVVADSLAAALRHPIAAAAMRSGDLHRAAGITPPLAPAPEEHQQTALVEPAVTTTRHARAGVPDAVAGSGLRSLNYAPDEDIRTRGDRPEPAPSRHVGLASRDSAPASDVGISVLPRLAGSASRVSPPVGTPALPPLVPHAIAQPPASGLSAPLLRQATRPEDPDADPGDTDRLADDIRRILRDEARRHGIALS